MEAKKSEIPLEKDGEAPPVSKILVFTSPPGGIIDSSGALANSLPLSLDEGVSALSTTAPFAAPISSGSVDFAIFGPLVTMTWPAIAPAATGGVSTTWTYVGFVPADFRPTSVQAAAINIKNEAVFVLGTCTVDTSGNVTFSADLSTGFAGGGWTTGGATSGFQGFTMAWLAI